jgi:hypothetical protein
MIRYLWDRMLKWGWDYNRDLREVDPQPTPRIRARGRDFDVELCDNSTGIDLPDPIVFKVQTVNGGTLVETRWYDHKKDESCVKLHIVTQEENLSESIGKIVTMELLQK